MIILSTLTPTFSLLTMMYFQCIPEDAQNAVMSFVKVKLYDLLTVSKLFNKIGFLSVTKLRFNPYMGMQVQKCTNIRSLNLSCNNIITDDCIKNLVNLKSLNLSCNTVITNEGIKNLVNLRSLDLRYNKNITDKGLEKLTNLKKLGLTNNLSITVASVEKLLHLRILKLKYDEIDAGSEASLVLTNIRSLNRMWNKRLFNISY